MGFNSRSLRNVADCAEDPDRLRVVGRPVSDPLSLSQPPSPIEQPGEQILRRQLLESIFEDQVLLLPSLRLRDLGDGFRGKDLVVR